MDIGTLEVGFKRPLERDLASNTCSCREIGPVSYIWGVGLRGHVTGADSIWLGGIYKGISSAILFGASLSWCLGVLVLAISHFG